MQILFDHFIPHHRNNHKAHALKPHFLLSYTLLLLAISYSFSFITLAKPGVLGIASDISVSEIIRLTNVEREKAGLTPLKENTTLAQSAGAKASDMFSYNYWAHISPTGKTPWDFIKKFGYQYSAAGENLARDFDKSPQVVVAWMASPSHRENLLSDRFSEIGVGVVNGTLEGRETTLVVQMFGTPVTQLAIAQRPSEEKSVTSQPQAVAKSEQVTPSPPAAEKPTVAVAPQVAKAQVIDVAKLSQKDKVFNNFAFQKTLTLILVAILSLLLLVDFWLVKKRGLVRQSSLPLAHLGLLIILFVAIWYTNSGLIL